MNYLEEYNQLKELLQESSSPTNSTQLETFKWLHSVWIEKGNEVLEGLQGFYNYTVKHYCDIDMSPEDIISIVSNKIPEELEAFPETFKKDKQELYKKLLSFE